MNRGRYIRERDVHQALGLVAEASGWDGSAPFSLEAVELLKDLFGADRGGYVEYRLHESPNRFSIESPQVRFTGSEEGWRFLEVWPLRDRYGESTVASRVLSDFFTRRQRHRNAFHNFFSAPLGVEDELKIWLPAPPQEARHFFFCRDRSWPDFGVRERTLAQLLAIRLATLREQWARRRPPASLTARELELLRLVAQGRTNREIAGELVISTGTVRKHLDHIYDKLDVKTRTAAAARLHNGRTLDYS